MEISQTRAFGSEGRKSTHDFLSCYSHSTSQQDPGPPSQDNYLKTHDFLQPLELVERKSFTTADDMSVHQRHWAPPPPIEHLLPGGMGTYTISHISYVNQRAPKSDDGSKFHVAQSTSMDRNYESCSSYTGGGFTLWEESASKKRKAGKENIAQTSTLGALTDSASMASQWTASSERPSQPSSNNSRICYTSHSSQTKGQKIPSFFDIIKSAEVNTHEEELDDGEEFTIKPEFKISVKGDLKVKVDGLSTEQKPNTPRSKHSATEQRRRSKINDRFQILRELIPLGDQKRDKASLLLEVIEYIHFLQEKVRKYEGSFQEWKHKPEKLMPLRNNPRPGESFVHQSCGVKKGSTPALLFAGSINEKVVTTSRAIPMTVQHMLELEMNTGTNLKASDKHPGTTKHAMALPLQLNSLNSLGNSSAVSLVPPRLASENTSQPQVTQYPTCACVTDANASGDKLKGNDLAIEGSTISISRVYSQGLLNTLTQALQRSGVDLSQGSISVQIEVGRQATNEL